MAQPHLRFTVVAAVTTAAAFAATPALASEPNVPPGPPPPPALVLPSFAPLPGAPAHAKRLSIRRVRVVPRHIRRGRRARLRLRLSSPARLRILVQRRTKGHRIRVRTLVVDAPAGNVSIRLPRRVHGHVLAPGRYRVSVVAIDGAGNRSVTVRRTLRVRRRAH
jgi:hypothetical protein